jgi:ATP-binding cassette subfamily B protein/subfamily B ATP-binding cassette protein MsbA
MRNFAQALKEAWRHWPTLAIAIVCSLGVATLWGANIAALFPIIETTVNGQSLQAWNQKRHDKAQQELATMEAEARQLEERAAAAADADERRQLTIQFELLQTRMQVARASAFSAAKLQPIIERFLPADPFSTVLFVVAMVALATALKQTLMLTGTMLISYVSQSIARDLRGRIFDKAISLDRPGFDSQGISGFAAHITSTTDMLATGITNFYGGAITEPLRIIACLSGALFMSWRLTLASLIFAPLAAFLILYLNRQIRGLSVRIINRSMGFHHVMLEVFNSLITVQSNTMEDFERQRFRESTGYIRRMACTATFYNSLTSPVTELMGMGMLCSGVIVSAYLVLNQTTTIFGIPMCDEPFNVPR